MRNWHPFIADALARSRAGRHSRRSASRSRRSSRRSACRSTSRRRSRRCRPACAVQCVRCLLRPPAAARGVRRTRPRGRRPQPDEEVVFTAHSLPERVIASGRPLRHEVAGHGARRRRARPARALPPWRSRAPGGRRSPGSAPTSADFIRERAAARRAADPRRADRLRLRPHRDPVRHRRPGARRRARECGVALRRTESLNDSPAFIAILADLVAQAAARPLCSRTQHDAATSTAIMPDRLTSDCRRRNRRPGGRLRAAPARSRVSACSSAAARPGGVDPQRADRRLHDRRRPRCAPDPEAGRASSCARNSGSATASSPPAPPRLAFIQRGSAGCTRCRRRRSSASPRNVSALAASAAVLVGREGADGEPSCSSAAARRRRADESIASFMRPPVRRRGGRPTWPNRCWPASTPGDVERLSMRALFPRFLEAEQQARQRAPRVPPACRAAGVERRRVHVAARRAGRDSSTRSVRVLPAGVGPLNTTVARRSIAARSSYVVRPRHRRGRRRARGRRLATPGVRRRAACCAPLDAELAAAVRRRSRTPRARPSRFGVSGARTSPTR